ncbi:hypothetical protein BGX28_005727 [Mortierella sp. GBA30]|nr:hypothetical protein BGX28_005727 [Mortierella sp. GBA30]
MPPTPAESAEPTEDTPTRSRYSDRQLGVLISFMSITSNFGKLYNHGSTAPKKGMSGVDVYDDMLAFFKKAITDDTALRRKLVVSHVTRDDMKSRWLALVARYKRTGPPRTGEPPSSWVHYNRMNTLFASTAMMNPPAVRNVGGIASSATVHPARLTPPTPPEHIQERLALLQGDESSQDEEDTQHLDEVQHLYDGLPEDAQDREHAAQPPAPFFSPLPTSEVPPRQLLPLRDVAPPVVPPWDTTMVSGTKGSLNSQPSSYTDRSEVNQTSLLDMKKQQLKRQQLTQDAEHRLQKRSLDLQEEDQRLQRRREDNQQKMLELMAEAEPFFAPSLGTAQVFEGYHSHTPTEDSESDKLATVDREVCQVVWCIKRGDTILPLGWASQRCDLVINPSHTDLAPAGAQRAVDEHCFRLALVYEFDLILVVNGHFLWRPEDMARYEAELYASS